MNKEKGFTLIELIVSIVIIGLIGLIVIPTTNNVIKRSKEKAYNRQMDIVFKAAREYVIEKDGLLPDGDGQKYIIEFDDLLSSGFLDKEKLINPVDDKEFEGCILLTYDEKTKKYKYEHKDECIITPSKP